jgi:hypothetical protein
MYYLPTALIYLLCSPLEAPFAHLVHLCISSLLTCALIPLASPSCAFSDFGQGSSSRSKQAALKRKGDSSVAGEVIRPSKMTARQREAEAKKKTKAPPRKTIDKLSLSEYSDYRKVDSVERNS